MASAKAGAPIGPDQNNASLGVPAALRIGWVGMVTFALLTTFVVCRFSPSLSVPEYSLLGAWMRARPARSPSPAIVLVGVTKSDFEHAQRRHSTDCACRLLPRSDIGKALARIKNAGAKVVVLDIRMSQTCPVGRGPDDERPMHDAPLTRALEMAPQCETIMVANTVITPSETYFTPPPGEVLGDAKPIIASPVVESPRGVVQGVRLIQRGSVLADEVAPLEPWGRMHPALCAAAYSAYRGYPCELPDPVRDHVVRCAGTDVPVSSGHSIYLLEQIMPATARSPSLHTMPINWSGPTGTFPMYSLMEVAKTAPTTLQRRFRGKIVIIGSLVDSHPTPMRARPGTAQWPLVDQSGERGMTGMEIHANALNTLLQGRFIRPLPPVAAWLLIAALSLVTILAFRLLRTWLAAGAVLLQIALLFAFAWVLIQHDCWLFAVLTTSAVLLSAVASTMWGFAVSRQEATVLAGEVEARDAVTTTLVHDLKQPLSAISALAAALRAQQTGALEGTHITPELLDRIQQQVETALGDIDELLTINPDRHLMLNIRSFDLARVVRDLATPHTMKSPYHEVVVDAPDEGAWVEADPRYLARAISNLMDNAIKYWPEGGTVMVRVVPTPPTATVEVIDDGMGISPEQQARVFSPFQRAVPDDSRIPGTGIGLFSVKRIAEAHGGTIEVDSEPGNGAVFTLVIPAVALLDGAAARVEGSYDAKQVGS